MTPEAENICASKCSHVIVQAFLDQNDSFKTIDISKGENTCWATGDGLK